MKRRRWSGRDLSSSRRWVLSSLWCLGVTWLGAAVAAEPAPVSTAPAVVQPLDDMVVVATADERTLFDTPYTSYFLSTEDTRLRLQPGMLPDALRAVPGVLLQKTGHGMTSPHLRGMTGQRVVLVADGVRLNNAILRDGPNQYWNTVDGMFYSSLEVLMGPGSVLYGSDAIGGVVYARSTPLTRGAPDRDFQWNGGEAYVRWASAEDSFSEHIEGEAAFRDKLSLRLGLTRQDFGDLTSGGHTDNPHTGYEDWGANLRGQWWLDANHSLVFGYDHFDQDGVERVHMTRSAVPFHGTTPGTDDRRTYDHDRRTAFARYEFRNGDSWLEEMDLQLSYQNMLENYCADRTTAKNRREYRTTRDDTFGMNLRLQSPSPCGTWIYGLDWWHDEVDSWGHNVKASTGAVTTLDQGQVGDNSTYDLAGVYVQNDLPLGERWELLTGVRYSWARMHAGDVLFVGPPNRVDSLVGEWDALTASARLSYDLLGNDLVKPFVGVSQGFRAPNLSDSTRDDEFGGGSEAPTADLDEERSTTYEAGIKARSSRGMLVVSAYRTDIHDLIERLQYKNGAKVPSKRNIDEAHINGVEASGSYRAVSFLELFGSVAWQEGSQDTYYGQDVAFPGDNRTMPRMMPLSGQAGVRWQPERARYWAEFSVDAAAEQDKIANIETTDNRFPPGGTPGWAVYNLRGGWDVTDALTLTLALENITDKDYRIHGSGVNEPGRNVVIAARATF